MGGLRQGSSLEAAQRLDVGALGIATGVFYYLADGSAMKRNAIDGVVGAEVVAVDLAVVLLVIAAQVLAGMSIVGATANAATTATLLGEDIRAGILFRGQLRFFC